MATQAYRLEAKDFEVSLHTVDRLAARLEDLADRTRSGRTPQSPRLKPPARLAVWGAEAGLPSAPEMDARVDEMINRMASLPIRPEVEPDEQPVRIPTSILIPLVITTVGVWLLMALALTFLVSRV
jgi:hypothetical protein